MSAQAEKDSLKEIFTRDFLAIATVNLTMFFGFQMTNIGMPVYVASLGAGAQVVGLVGTLITITATVVRIFSGPMLDRFGRKGALVAGTFIMLCTMVSYAVFPIVGVILGLRLLHGIGWGLGSTASSTIAADVVPKRRFAEGMGYFAMTSSLSSALAPALSVFLVQGPGAIYMIGVAGALTALAFVLSLFQSKGLGRARGEQRKAADKEADAQNHGEAAGQAAAEVPHGAPPQGKMSFLDTVFERRALVAGMLILFVNMGFGSITTFITLHGQQQGIGNVSLYFIVYALVSLAGRPPIGRLIDRYGYRVPSVLSTLCTAGTLVFIGASTNIYMLAGAGVLAGLGLGTAMSVFQAMAVASVEPWRRGVATSTYLIAFDLGIAIGSFFSGIVAGMTSYSTMYTIVAVFPLIACVLSLFLVKRGAGRPQD